MFTSTEPAGTQVSVISFVFCVATIGAVPIIFLNCKSAPTLLLNTELPLAPRLLPSLASPPPSPGGAALTQLSPSQVKTWLVVGVPV